jgi:hypothetical protein
LLAKDPADRFPNTQVLARHLQAMINALSRPAADDFALAPDQPPAANHHSAVLESLSADATQAEVVPPQPGQGRAATVSPNRTEAVQASQSAATLAADEVHARHDSRGVSASPPATLSVAPLSPERPTRFTTLEEEEQRLRAQNQRPWVVVVAQLAAFATVLALLGGVALFLSRPPSADKLYASIDARVEGEDDSSLVKVENEVNDFLDRFPNDSRAELLRGYKERIDLGKLERKLQRQSRGNNADASLLPAEQLYLQAANLAATSPEKSQSIFESLVSLYGPDTSVSPGNATASDKTNRDNLSSDRTADVVQLAKRRLERIRTELARQRQQQLAALAERLGAAARISETNPQQAVEMYQAILNLHEDDVWAADVVQKARTRLAELEKK